MKKNSINTSLSKISYSSELSEQEKIHLRTEMKVSLEKMLESMTVENLFNSENIYTKITSIEQYNQYAKVHEALNSIPEERHDQRILNELKLLDVLLETYDREYLELPQRDPLESLKSHMENNGYSAETLSEELGIDKIELSDILNYQRKMSKAVINKISNRFRLNPNVFNNTLE